MRWKEKLTKPFDLYEISRLRPYLMGLAALWITFYHSKYLNLFQSSFLTKTHLLGLVTRIDFIGNCGVDLFFFLSGLGLYFSYTRLLEKNPRPAGSFYRRRYGRILPTILIVTVLTYGLLPMENRSDWFGAVLLYGFFVPGRANGNFWYLSATMLFYLVFPLIHAALRGKRSTVSAAALVLAAFGLSFLIRFCFRDYYFAQGFFLFANRVPVFLLGAWMGKCCYEHRTVPRFVPMLSVPVSFLLLVLIADLPMEGYVRLYTYAAFVPCLVLAHAYAFSHLKKWGFFTKAVMAVGTCSMEIYLLYESIYNHAEGLFANSAFDETGLIYALTVFAATLVLAVLLKTVSAWLSRQFEAQSGSSRS